MNFILFGIVGCFSGVTVLRLIELRPVVPAVGGVDYPGDIHCYHRPVSDAGPHYNTDNVDDYPPNPLLAEAPYHQKLGEDGHYVGGGVKIRLVAAYALKPETYKVGG